MRRARFWLFATLALTSAGCASDYAERYRRAHPDWGPATPATGDSLAKTLAEIQADREAPVKISIRELRVMRVDVEPWQRLSSDAVATSSPEQTIGVVAALRCKGRRGIRFFQSERNSWYIFVAGALASYDHVEFGEACRPQSHYHPSGVEQVSMERALIRYAAQRHPGSAPGTEEMLDKGLALVSVGRLEDARRMLRKADRELDFMTEDHESLPDEERKQLETEERRLRALRAKLSRAIRAAPRQREQASD
jgi:hypothetical protein